MLFIASPRFIFFTVALLWACRAAPLPHQSSLLVPRSEPPPPYVQSESDEPPVYVGSSTTAPVPVGSSHPHNPGSALHSASSIALVDSPHSHTAGPSPPSESPDVTAALKLKKAIQDLQTKRDDLAKEKGNIFRRFLARRKIKSLEREIKSLDGQLEWLKLKIQVEDHLRNPHSYK